MDLELYAIQKRLKELGFDPGPLDGVWGKQTRGAIAAHLGIDKAPKTATLAAPWLDLAKTQIGEREAPGGATNPDIAEYFKASVNQAHADSVPWCAAFVGAMLVRSGYQATGSLMARSYLEWGTRLDKPREGAVVVFKRGEAPAGHVGFVVDWDANKIKCLGGNQSDAVTVAGFSRASVLGYRWPAR